MIKISDSDMRVKKIKNMIPSKKLTRKRGREVNFAA